MSREWPQNECLARLDYEQGEGRYKHKWDRDEAGFVPSGRGPIGKCHNSITADMARRLLRSGIVAPDPYSLDPPGTEHVKTLDKIYNVYQGVPYVAVPTRPGFSYHGYPWRGRMSATVREKLRQRADDEGTRQVLEKWLKHYTEK